MGLKEKITEDLKEALKAGDGARLGVLRMLSSAIYNREIEIRSKGDDKGISEEEILAVLEKEAKKRRESAGLYRQGGREELAGKEEAEIEVIFKYLPPRLKEEEIKEIIRSVIEELGGRPGPGDLGKIIGKVSAKTKGRADSSEVASIVKGMLTEYDQQ